jgi:hypothetical protein
MFNNEGKEALPRDQFTDRIEETGEMRYGVNEQPWFKQWGVKPGRGNNVIVASVLVV